MEIFNKPIGQFAIDLGNVSMKKMENGQEHIFDNSTQGAIGQFYLSINFSDFPNKYKCITEIIDWIELGYYLKGEYNGIIKLLSSDLIIINNYKVDNRRAEIFKSMINFDGMCHI